MYGTDRFLLATGTGMRLSYWLLEVSFLWYIRTVYGRDGSHQSRLYLFPPMDNGGPGLFTLPVLRYFYCIDSLLVMLFFLPV
jgi:hypothetical protein